MSGPPTHTAPGEVHAHPRHTGQRWFDLIAAVTALFISAISLFVGIEHSETTRKLVAANTWPILQADQDVDEFDPTGDGRLLSGPLIRNAGVGPAKIERFTMLYAGKPYKTYGDLLRDCCGYQAGDPAWSAQMMPRGIGYAGVTGTVLRPNRPSMSSPRARRPTAT